MVSAYYRRLEVSATMEEQQILPYPYELTPLEPEEQAEIDKLYDGKYKNYAFYGRTTFQENELKHRACF